MSLHIAVFAKAPVAGLTKTRLIPLLGPDGAADAHRQMTELALRSALQSAPGQVSLWSAGAHDHPYLIECCQRFGITACAQPEGDLGQRMTACLSQLLVNHQRVLLIGSDCPALSSADLQSAARALEQGARLVFTPAEDGGYVLVGATRDGAAGFAAVFDAMTWSTDRVMAQTRSRLSALGWQHGPDWAEVPQRWDVDEPADYLRAVQLGLLAD
jgi:rSAM/selenodomain-associated transferase 1